jgi:hypothetical protein
MANRRRSKDELKEIDALLERLREFIRLKYMTAAEVARQIGVRDTTIYDWFLGKARPAKPERITAFLDSLPRGRHSYRCSFFGVCAERAARRSAR